MKLAKDLNIKSVIEGKLPIGVTAQVRTKDSNEYVFLMNFTEEEKKEQAELRQEYLAAVRKNLRAQLNNINIQEKDGSIVNLGEKYGRKKGN